MLDHLAGHSVAVLLQVGAASNGAERFGERTPRNAKANERRSPEPNLDPHYTFENFVEGKSNQLGKAAAMQVAQNPGRAYNPLLLYGGTGLGKTHLMHAAGNLMRAHKPDTNVMYLRSEQFVSGMVRALQQKDMDDFKRRFRSVDALLIDDIQFFAGKNTTQEEFFHTFNALIEGKQQIILTCDRYPKEVENLEPRLEIAARLGFERRDRAAGFRDARGDRARQGAGERRGPARRRRRADGQAHALERARSGGRAQHAGGARELRGTQDQRRFRTGNPARSADRARAGDHDP